MTPAFALQMSPLRQRALALGVLLILLGLLLGAIVAPVLLLHRHYDAAIADLSDKLTRYRRVAAQAPELRAALEAMKAKDGRRFYLRNTAVNLAGAELQESVKAAIENNGGRITTSQNTTTRDDGRFRQIGVNVQFFATTPALQKILTALETQEPYLVIENIAVRPLNAFRGFKPGPGQEPELNLQLDVSAWAYPEPAKAPAAPAAKS
ncbi:MAG TPA: type II secretion system protein GspM [Casimicrobiaceae bacterium]|nr:type II secretion system protein GspM [Casimicrobiaceae bacterium]